MRNAILALATVAIFATTAAPAFAKSSRYATNDGKYNLKTSQGIAKFWRDQDSNRGSR